MKKYKIVQIKSRIRKPEKQKRTLDALGIRRMNSSVIVNASPQIEGMIQKVQHLVRVEEVKE
ncbi:MAG: 50S ribosomal protein L30 [Bacteroidales bacterium]